MNRQDIIKRKFSHSFFGYDVEDVDLFLDEIIREFDRIHNELDIAELKAEGARQREEKMRRRAEAYAARLCELGIAPEELEPADELLRTEEPYAEPEPNETESVDTEYPHSAEAEREQADEAYADDGAEDR